MHKFKICVGNSNAPNEFLNNTICYENMSGIDAIEVHNARTIICPANQNGRYVALVSYINNYLEFAELKVYSEGE